MGERDERLTDLLRQLERVGYGFVTPGNDTHRRVVRQRHLSARGLAGDLRDVFGWNLPFRPGTVGSELFGAMQAAGILVRRRRFWRSALRVASLDRTLFWHSAWPPTARDAVFFGPDSYRFAAFVRAELPPGPLRVADIGTGSGVGAICAALARPVSSVWGSDLNPAALDLARINAAAAGVELTLVQGSGLAGLDGLFDVIIANPPFFAGRTGRYGGGRLYRDGGDGWGTQVALAWAEEAASRLAPGGRLLLYSGAPVVDGVDKLREGLEQRLTGLTLRYREIDPDIFGGLLNHPRYWRVERIAAVGLVAERNV